jgi:hypothetical protein
VGFFEGLLGGFQTRKGEVEKRNFDLGQQQSEKEAAIFQHLSQSDDPQIRTLALTGLLDSANPRRKSKGLKGWIGETEASPYLAQMSSLINTPVTEHGSYQLPGEAQGINGPIQGLPNVTPTIQHPPAGGASAAMPATSMVDANVQAGPPPAPMSYTQPPPTPFTTSRMRNVFLTGADKVKADKVAAAQGDIAGKSSH